MANQLNEVLAQLQQENAEKLLQKQRIIETKSVFYLAINSGSQK